MRLAVPLLVTAFAASLASSALAQEAPSPARPTRDAPVPARSSWDDTARPWLYSADPSAPPAGHVLAALGVSYAQVDRGAARPFAADRARAGAVMTAAADVGLHRFVSIQAEGLLAGQGPGESVGAGAMLGVTFHPLRASSRLDLAASAGYLRELDGGNGAWGRIAVAGDLGPVRLAATVIGSHIFVKGRDDLDVLITSGASVAVIPILRLGAEYVIQDLEGIWDPEEADGGVRHFVGATASLEITKRVRLSAGPAFGLSSGSPAVLGRLVASYAF